MIREEAVRRINDLVSAEVEVMKQFNLRGVITKKADKAERDAACALFKALVGSEPSASEIAEMTGV